MLTFNNHHTKAFITAVLANTIKAFHINPPTGELERIFSTKPKGFHIKDNALHVVYNNTDKAKKTQDALPTKISRIFKASSKVVDVDVVELSTLGIVHLEQWIEAITHAYSAYEGEHPLYVEAMATTIFNYLDLGYAISGEPISIEEMGEDHEVTVFTKFETVKFTSTGFTCVEDCIQRRVVETTVLAEDSDVKAVRRFHPLIVVGDTVRINTSVPVTILDASTNLVSEENRPITTGVYRIVTNGKVTAKAVTLPDRPTVDSWVGHDSTTGKNYIIDLSGVSEVNGQNNESEEG